MVTYTLPSHLIQFVVCLIIASLRHKHLPSLLPDDADDPGVRDRGTDVHGLGINAPESGGVSGERAQLHLDAVQLQQRRALAHIVAPIRVLAGALESAQEPLHVRDLVRVQVHLGQLQVRVEPQPVVISVLQCIQSDLVHL